jgi:hypothetical protein
MNKRAKFTSGVSTDKQTIENQLCELHRIAESSGVGDRPQVPRRKHQRGQGA